MTHWKIGAVIFVFAMSTVMSGSANAGWFGSSDEKASFATNDGAVAQIQQAIDDDRLVDAGNLMDHALISGSMDPRLTLLAGELSLARGRYDVALASFKQVDTQPGVRTKALECEGIALTLLGRSDEALPALESAVAADAAAWHAWNALGVLYDRRHEWSKAEAAYDHAMATSKSSPLVLNNRGFSRLSQNRLEEAAADFVAALQRKPDFASARNNLRLAIAMKGDYARATEGASASDRASILNNAGFAAMTRGDYSTAENLLGQAIQAKGEFYSLATANLELVRGLKTNEAVGIETNAATH